MDDFAVKGYCSDANFMRLKRAESLAREKRVTIPQLALAWVLNQPLLPMAVCSASTPKRMISNLKALDVKLTAEEIRWLSEG